MRVMILCVSLFACDTPESTGREEAGEVAIACVQRMPSCEDWTPINMAKGKMPRTVPDCFEHEKYTEERRNCNDRAEGARYHNKMIEDAPRHRSPRR